MNSTDPPLLEVSALASITVTFNPDLFVLERQLRALKDVGKTIIVDNASLPATLDSLRALTRLFPRAELIENAENIGLAAGLNIGLAVAIESSCSAVLLLDQDSEFESNVPRALLDALNGVQKSTGKLCCVGPVLHDPETGLDHGFHYIANGWRWARAYPDMDGRKPFALANLNGSGTLMSLDIVEKIGRFDEDLFIDHVDTDWSFRVLSNGCGLFGVPWLRFDHRMGEAGRRVWLLGWRVWPERSPHRHYFLFRNTVRLMKRAYVPRVWKLWAALKMALTLITTFIIDRRRVAQLRLSLKGFADGMRESVK